MKSIWKGIVAFSVVLGIVAPLLQILGAVNFWDILILPLHDFLLTTIPIYYSIVFVVVCIVIYSAIEFARRRRRCILDFEDARRIALLCQTPRTTAFLKQRYDYWESQSSLVFLGGYGFDDYMKRSEKEGFLEYIEGRWRVTTKALEYISKYHGDSFR